MYAQERITWTGEGDGETWSDANNWDTGSVPSASDDVVIDAEGSSYTVYVDGTQSVRGLMIDSGRATLDVLGELEIDNLTHLDGTITGTGTIVIEGEMIWTGGNISGTGTTILNGPAVTQSTSFLRPNRLSSRTIEVNDHLLIEEGYIEPRQGATIIIEEDAVLEFGEGSTGFNPGASSTWPILINKGLIIKPSGDDSRGTLGGQAQFNSDRRMRIENYGEIRAEAGNISIYVTDGAVIEGTYVSNGQSIDFHHSGGLNADPIMIGGTLRGSAMYQFYYALHLTGELDVEGAMLVRDGQVFTEDLTIIRLENLIINTNRFTEYVFTFATPGEPTIGTLQVDGRFHIASDLVVERSASVGIQQFADITGDAKLTVRPGGALVWGYGAASGSGTIHAQGDMVSMPVIMPDGDWLVQHSGAHLTGTDLIIDGEAIWDDGDLVLDGGASVTINETGSFVVQRDADIVGGEAATGDERFLNYGTFRKDGIGRRISEGNEEPAYDDISHGMLVRVAFENHGTLSTQAGMAAFAASFIQDGTIEGTSSLLIAEADVQLLGGRIAPGPGIGNLTINGDLDLGTQRLEIELAGAEHDQLTVEGDLVLGGTLVAWGIDHRPADGDRYVIASATGSVSGDFSEIILTDLGSVAADVQIVGSEVVLSFEVDDEGAPLLAVDTEEVRFDDAAPGGGSRGNFTISNEGDADLTISSTVLDPEDAPFVWEDLDDELAPGESRTVDMAFQPQQPGEFEATLTISTNAGTAEIRLVGSSSEEHVPAPLLAVDTEEVRFDDAAPGGGSRGTFTISNEGDADLTISSTVLDPEDAPFVWEDLDDELAPGESRTVDMAFQPQQPGTFEATLTISTNAGSAEIRLHGTAPAGEDQPPIAADDRATTLRGQPVVIDVLANDSDPDGGTLLIESVTQPENGTAKTDGESITYAPEAGFTGTDRFAYVVINEAEKRAEASVTVDVVAFGFTITDVSPLADRPSKATSISRDGIVAGVTLTETGVTPFSWGDGISRLIDVYGSAAVTPYSVDDNGGMVGVAVDGDSTSRAVIIHPNGTIQNLGSLGGDFAVAFDRNQNGVIVGTSADHEATYHAFYWVDGMRALALGTGSHSEAFSINDRGEMAGVVTMETGEHVAFVNSRVVQESNTRAYSINNVGLSVGSALVDGKVVGVGWSSDGRPTALTSDESDFTEAYAVNDAGWIVGSSGSSHELAGKSSTSTGAAARWMAGPRTSFMHGLGLEETAGKSADHESLHATLWTEGGERFDLNDLIHGPADGWQLIEARDINASGKIVGYGLKNGRTAAFLLTPVDGEAPLPRSITRDVEGTAPLMIYADELADINGNDALVLLGADSPDHGTIEIADDGDHLIYEPTTRITAQDAFNVYLSNGLGSAVSAQVQVNLLSADPDVKLALRLHPNFPNPFSSSTNIKFAVPESGAVRIVLFDMLGREVRVMVDDERSPGIHETKLSANDLASGTYLIRLSSSAGTDTRMVNVVR